jgi:enoyl-CoA hydratase/carnithine racemase
MTFNVDRDVLSLGSISAAQKGFVLTVTLDRPEALNAMTPATWAALAAIGEAITPDVRSVIVTGRGRAFSAGLDRTMLSPAGPPGERGLVDIVKGTDEEIEEEIKVYQRGYTWLRRPDIISIAAVRGHCIGAGFQLALACDIRLAGESALFSMREPKLGLVPDLTGTKPLVDAVGYSRALEIVASARDVGVDEALKIGLVHRVVRNKDLESESMKLAMSVTQHSHEAVSASKALLQGASGRTLAAQTELERIAQVKRLRALAELLGESGT